MSEEIENNQDTEKSPDAIIETPSTEVDKSTSPAEFDFKEGDEEFTGKSNQLPEEERLAILNDKVSTVISTIEQMKKANLSGTKEELAAYSEVVQAAMFAHPQYNADVNPFDNIGSLWRSKVEHEGTDIGPYRPRYASNGPLSGELASIRAREAAELGTQLGFPFWRSGLWLKLRAPSDITLLEMERRIAMEKISLGRSTLGSALTSTSSFMQAHVMDSLLNHVVDGSFENLTPIELKKVIKIPDVMPLITAWACTIWPDAYPVTQPCVKDPTKCTHLTHDEIKLLKLFKTNNRLTTTFQRNFMQDREANNSVADLERYQQEHKLIERTIKLTDTVSAVLHVPSLYDMEVSSFRWIDNIVTRADDAFGQELRGTERNRFISEQGTATTLRRVAHWIKEIVYENGDKVVDRDGIDSSLDVWSSVESIRENLLREVNKFNRESVLTGIGYRRFDCPKCKGEADEGSTLPNVPEVITIDPLAVFFTLQRMKVTKIRNSAE